MFVYHFSDDYQRLQKYTKDSYHEIRSWNQAKFCNTRNFLKKREYLFCKIYLSKNKPNFYVNPKKGKIHFDIHS